MVFSSVLYYFLMYLCTKLRVFFFYSVLYGILDSEDANSDTD